MFFLNGNQYGGLGRLWELSKVGIAELARGPKTESKGSTPFSLGTVHTLRAVEATPIPVPCPTSCCPVPCPLSVGEPAQCRRAQGQATKSVLQLAHKKKSQVTVLAVTRAPVGC